MEQTGGWTRYPRSHTAFLAGSLAVLLAAGEIFIDVVTQIHLNVSIVYSLALVLAAATRRVRLVWGLMAFLVAVTFGVYSAQIPAGAFSLHEPFFVNRVLSAVTLLLIAGMLHAWIRAVNALDVHRRLLEERNAQLEAANRELVLREEQIGRQNEELEARRLAAEVASSRKTQMLASVSHDIRTPVHAIGMLAEVIGRTAEDPLLAPKIPQMAHRLRQNARSLAALLADSLDMVRFDSGEMPLHKSQFALATLLEEQCLALIPLASAKGLALRVRAGPDVWLSTERAKLARVVSNLVGNAIKFTRQGEVRVEASLSNEGAVAISVRDTGIGIDPRHVRRIFEEFARLGGEPASVQGWGLGLAICRRFVAALGGTISVESRVDEGSVFVVRLPAACVASRGEREVVGVAGTDDVAHGNSASRP